MMYKLIVFMLFMWTMIGHAFPQLSADDVAIQSQLTRQINATPNDAGLRFELAMAYASTGWIELGWEQLKLVPELHKNYEQVVMKNATNDIEKNPNHWPSHFKLAFAHYVMKDRAAAMQSFKTVLKIKPDHVWSMGFIALLLGEEKKYDDGIAWCKKALKINDNATAIHFLLGQAYYETGNYFGVLGETLSVGRLKSIEAKYRPTPPVGIE
jgi:tetratricopeptide (TPR) repeat protein